MASYQSRLTDYFDACEVADIFLLEFFLDFSLESLANAVICLEEVRVAKAALDGTPRQKRVREPIHGYEYF